MACFAQNLHPCKSPTYRCGLPRTALPREARLRGPSAAAPSWRGITTAGPPQRTWVHERGSLQAFEIGPDPARELGNCGVKPQDFRSRQKRQELLDPVVATHA